MLRRGTSYSLTHAFLIPQDLVNATNYFDLIIEKDLMFNRLDWEFINVIPVWRHPKKIVCTIHHRKPWHQFDDWFGQLSDKLPGTEDANDAIDISFVRPAPTSSSLETILRFHPEFTYQIFGYDQVIFGYRDLQISLRFAAHHCRPQLSIKYDEKFPQVGDAKAVDVKEELGKYLPDNVFDRTFDDELLSEQSARDWRPPGRLAHQYTRNGRTFEVWMGSLLDSRVRGLLNNIQILVLFFIEGGQPLPINEDPDWSLERWQVYYIYEKTTVTEQRLSPYVLCGYATTYRFHRFITPASRPTASNISTIANLEPLIPSEQPCRLRISQFIILPPFQHDGHGSELYRLIYRTAMHDSAITELTVEDPSEEFDRLRDVNDFKVLESEFRAANVKLNISIHQNKNRIDKVPYKELLDHGKLKSIRISKKIAPRQFSRMVELYLLSNIPASHRDPIGANTTSNTKLLIQKHKTANLDDRTYYWWRLLLRYRIFKQNEDVLMGLADDGERLKHSNDTSRGQQDEYEGMLARMAEKMIREFTANGKGSHIATGAKRKTIIDDEDDDDDDDAASTVSKRSRKAPA